MPVVAGHEGAGIVQAVGDGVTRVQIGEQVGFSTGHPTAATVLLPAWSPQPVRHLCRADLGRHNDGRHDAPFAQRPTRHHFSGLACFADYAVVPQESCADSARVPAAVTAVLGCAVTTGVGAALNTTPVQPGDTVAVLVPAVGLSTIMGAKLAGAERIIAVDDVSAEKAQWPGLSAQLTRLRLMKT